MYRMCHVDTWSLCVCLSELPSLFLSLRLDLPSGPPAVRPASPSSTNAPERWRGNQQVRGQGVKRGKHHREEELVQVSLRCHSWMRRWCNEERFTVLLRSYRGERPRTWAHDKLTITPPASPPPPPNPGIDSWGLWGARWIICGQKRAAGERKNSETKVIKWWSQQLHELFIFVEPRCPPSASLCALPLQPPRLSKPTAVQALLKLWFSFSSCHFSKDCVQ